jgi:hypothetical protein
MERGCRYLQAALPRYRYDGVRAGAIGRAIPVAGPYPAFALHIGSLSVSVEDGAPAPPAGGARRAAALLPDSTNHDSDGTLGTGPDGPSCRDRECVNLSWPHRGGADSIQRRNTTTSNPRYPAGWTIREGMGLVRSIKLIWLCAGSSGDRPKSPRRGTGRPRRCGSRPVAGSRSKVPLGGVDTFRWRQSRRSPERGPLGTDRAPLVPDPSVTSVPTRSTGGRRQWTQPDNGRELRLRERRMNIVGLARCWSGR